MRNRNPNDRIFWPGVLLRVVLGIWTIEMIVLIVYYFNGGLT